jgi:chemotaxis protein methyltransferase CheR
MSLAATASLRAGDFDYVAGLVYRHAAVVLDDGKEWLVESRLAGLAELSGAASVGELLARLRGSPFGDLHRRVIDALLTHETLFFRDYVPFEALQRGILPALIEKRRSERRLTFWSAACSSGQEAYSIAMVIHDALPDLAEWRVRILASDISAAMVARARAASYSQVEINRGLPAAMLVKHFEQQGPRWVIAEPLRRLVELRELNLAASWPPLPPMDVIFLRNVLIYLDQETRRSILERVRRLLRPDGCLVLGSAETTLTIDPAFEPLKVGRAVCYRLRA